MLHQIFQMSKDILRYYSSCRIVYIIKVPTDRPIDDPDLIINYRHELSVDIVNIGLHFFLKNVRPYAASCSEA